MAKIVLDTASLNTLNASLNVSDFRAMVNYESGKNKGYVRLTRSSDGRFGIEKINNKIDIAVNSRTNVNAANNRALRTAFAAALSRGMFGANEEQKASVKKIALALGANDPTISETPLSRREIRNALALYDRVMNSPSARRTMAEDLVKKAVSEAKIPLSTHDFLDKYLNMSDDFYTGPHEAFFRYEDGDVHTKWEAAQVGKKSFRPIDEYDVKGAWRSAPMAKDDVAFVCFMKDFERRLQLGVEKFQLERELRDTADAVRAGILAPNDIFAGDQLTDEFKTRLEKALVLKLAAQGIDVEKGTGEIGSHRTVLHAFLKQVVPALIREARHGFEMTKPEGEETTEARDARIDTLLDLDEIVAHAQAFFRRVDEALKPPTDAFGQQGAEMAKNSLTGAAQSRSALDVMKHVKVDKAEAQHLGAEIAKEAPSLLMEEKINKAAEAYVKETCPSVVIASDLAAQGASDLVRDRVDDVILAAQLNLGERWEVEGGKFVQDTSVQGFLHEGSNLITEYCNVNHGGMPMYTKLMEKTLVKYVNERIDHARAWGHDARLKLGKTDAQGGEFQNLVAGAADSYVNFRRDVEGASRAAMKAFGKILDREVKNGHLTEASREYLLNTVLANALKENAETSLDLLLDRTTTGLKDDKELEGRIERAVKRTIQRSMAAAYHELSLVTGTDKIETNYLDKSKKLREAVDTRIKNVRQMFYDTILQAHTNMAEETNNVLGAQVAGLGKEERAAFVKTVTDEVVSRLKGAIDQQLVEYREDPEVYKSDKAVFDLLTPLLQGNGRDSALSVLTDVLEDRAAAYQKWMGLRPEDRAATVDELAATVITDLQKDASTLPRDVLAKLAEAPKKALFEKTEAHVAWYAQSAGAEATKAKIADELKATLAALLKPFARTANAFLGEVDKLAAEHAGITVEERDEIARSVLMFAAGSKEPAKVTLKSLEQLFHQSMNDKLMGKVDRIYADFEDFVAKMDKAEKRLPDVQARFEQAFDAAAANLPENVKKHFHEVTLKRYTDELNTILCTTPEKFFDENVDELISKAGQDALARADAAKRSNVLDAATHDQLLIDAGLGLYVHDAANYPDEIKEMRANLATYATDATNAAHVEELLCRLVDGDTAAREEIVSDVRDYAAPVAGRLHLAAFNQMELPEALKLFDDWLESYGEMGFKGILDTDLGGGNTLRSLAREPFIAHYKDIANHLVKNEKAEPLLTQELLLKLVALFGTTGVAVAKEHLLAELSRESILKASAHLQGLIDSFKKGPLSQFELDRFYERLDQVVETIRNDISNDVDLHLAPGFENYARCEETVKARFEAIVAKETHELSLSFQYHMGLALQTEKQMDDARAKLQTTFDGWKGNIANKKGTEALQAYGDLFDELRKRFDGIVLDHGRTIMGEVDDGSYANDGEKRLMKSVDDFLYALTKAKNDALAIRYNAFRKENKKIL